MSAWKAKTTEAKRAEDYEALYETYESKYKVNFSDKLLKKSRADNSRAVNRHDPGRAGLFFHREMNLLHLCGVFENGKEAQRMIDPYIQQYGDVCMDCAGIFAPTFWMRTTCTRKPG